MASSPTKTHHELLQTVQVWHVSELQVKGVTDYERSHALRKLRDVPPKFHKPRCYDLTPARDCRLRNFGG